MSVRVITHIQTKPGAAEEFISSWDRKRYDDVIGLPGCDQYELFQSALEPERLAVIEAWESRSAYLSAWKIIRVQVPVALDLLAAETDQPHSGHKTEIYWNAAFSEAGDPPPTRGGRLIINENIDPANVDAYIDAWKAHTAGAGADEHDLLLGTRNIENTAELSTWSNDTALAGYLSRRFGADSLVASLLASPEDHYNGQAGLEVYDAPAIFRWNGSEWAAAAGVTG